MKKRVKKYGNSLVIVITPEDQDLYGIKEGDVIELGEMLVQEQKKK